MIKVNYKKGKRKKKIKNNKEKKIKEKRKMKIKNNKEKKIKEKRKMND